MPSADPSRTREVVDSSRTSHSEKLETFPEMPQNAPKCTIDFSPQVPKFKSYRIKIQ